MFLQIVGYRQHSTKSHMLSSNSFYGESAFLESGYGSLGVKHSIAASISTNKQRIVGRCGKIIGWIIFSD
mgnify:FL=1